MNNSEEVQTEEIFEDVKLSLTDTEFCESPANNSEAQTEDEEEAMSCQDPIALPEKPVCFDKGCQTGNPRPTNKKYSSGCPIF